MCQVEYTPMVKYRSLRISASFGLKPRSSLQEIILIPFRLVLVFWRLLKEGKEKKSFLSCDVIVVQKSSTGDKNITLYGWGYNFLPFPPALSPILHGYITLQLLLISDKASFLVPELLLSHLVRCRDSRFSISSKYSLANKLACPINIKNT